MGVVDHKQHRCTFGQVGHKPIQAVQCRPTSIPADRDCASGGSRVNHGRGKPGRTGDQTIAFSGRGRSYGALEELANHREGHVSLQFARYRGQHLDSFPVSAVGGDIEQPSLAYTCRALYDNHLTIASRARSDQVVDPGQLGVALQHGFVVRRFSGPHTLFPRHAM